MRRIRIGVRKGLVVSKGCPEESNFYFQNSLRYKQNYSEQNCEAGTDYQTKEESLRSLDEKGFGWIVGVVMDVYFIRELVRRFLRPLFGVVLWLLNPFGTDAIADELSTRNVINVLDQWSVTEGWWARGVVRRKRAAFDHFSLRDRPTIES